MYKHRYESVRECPDCGSKKTLVIDSRPDSRGLTIRRKICGDCSFKWDTVEMSLEDSEYIDGRLAGVVGGNIIPKDLKVTLEVDEGVLKISYNGENIGSKIL